VPATDDTLRLYFLCAHPSLPASSAVALTLRAVGGLTTRQIAAAYLVPEATMAQRISRAKRRVAGVRLDEPGDLATVLRVLYLVFNEGYSGDVDLAAEAIRLARQLAALSTSPRRPGCSRSCCCTTRAGRPAPDPADDVAQRFQVLVFRLEVRESGRKKPPSVLAAAGAHAPAGPVSPYIEVAPAQLQVTLAREPRRVEVPMLCDEQLVVEYYSR
jgi:hypothetical protein